MKMIDLSGVIRPGLWKYGPMYPDFSVRSIQAEPTRFFCECFDGFHSQTGTYLETMAHVNGYENQTLLQDLPLERMVQVPCRVLHLDRERLAQKKGRIDAELLEAAQRSDIPPRCAILFESGWTDWYAPNFLTDAPYLSRDAMEWLLAHNPSLIGSDTPGWEKHEPVFDLICKTDTLLLAPLVSLDTARGTDAFLTALPVNLPNTCCAPARVVLTEEE